MTEPELPKMEAPAPNTEAESSNAPQPTNLPEKLMYKNRLQEYSQKSALPLPVYQTTNDGPPHSCHFRSTVLVDGTYYRSPNSMPNRKAAEQDVAKFALFAIMQKIKNEGTPLLLEDAVFCKSTLNEYAVKMNMEIPTYTTFQPKVTIPVFFSSLVFNGVTYTGEAGKNKKEAEQLAARAVILSILDSETGMIMYEIIKSKNKLYYEVNIVKNSLSHQDGTMPVGVQPGLGIPLSKGKEVEVVPGTDNMPITAIPATSLGQPTNLSASYPSVCEYRNPNPVASYAAITPPIVFVPPVSNPTLLFGSSPGRKRNRKNKKKAQKKMRADPQLPVAVVPLSQVPPCSVAQ